MLLEKSRPSSSLHSSTENVFGARAQLPDESEVQDKDKLVNMDLMTGIDGMPCTSSIILQKIDNLWELHFKQN